MCPVPGTHPLWRMGPAHTCLLGLGTLLYSGFPWEQLREHHKFGERLKAKKSRNSGELLPRCSLKSELGSSRANTWYNSLLPAEQHPHHQCCIQGPTTWASWPLVVTAPWLQPRWPDPLVLIALVLNHLTALASPFPHAGMSHPPLPSLCIHLMPVYLLNRTSTKKALGASLTQCELLALPSGSKLPICHVLNVSSTFLVHLLFFN